MALLLMTVSVGSIWSMTLSALLLDVPLIVNVWPSLKSFNLVPEDVKDPKKAFPEVAHYYMDDPTREVKKLKISEDIDQKYKKAEKEIEDLQAASVAKQKELHEKYSTH